MANELHASGFAVSPGAPVVFKQRACIVRRVLSTDRVIIEDIDTGRSEVAFINQLSSIATLVPEHEAGATGEMIAGPSALPPALLAFTAAEIAKAEKRLDVIAPLLAMRKRSRKDVEDHARQSGVSAVTLYKWIKNYNGCGSLVGLMDGKRGAPSITKLDERVEQFIQEAIDQLYLSSQQLTPRDIYQTVKDRCELERKPVPHENTVRNRIAALPQNRVRRKRGQAALADKDLPTPGVFPEPSNPLNPVQIDHVQLDMIVVFSDTRMPWGRPWLTLAVDCLTRVIVGFYLSMDRPSAVAAGMTLAMGMLPKQDYLASLGLPGRWPVHGKIRKVLCDNAKEFRGEALKFGCKENSIDLDLRPVKQPRYGAYIERLVGNVNMMLRKKPGTTFSNPQQRGTYDSKKKSAYTLHELEIEIADWVVNHYHVHKHGALMKPPLIVWEEKILGTDGAMAAGLPIQIADPEKLKLDFLPLESRVVSPSGVRMNKADYYHEALNRWINASDPDHPSEKRKFTVKYHPRRRREVWFLDPEVKQYVKLDRYPFQAPGDDEVDGYVGVEEHIAIEARRQHEGSQLEDKKAKAGYRLRSAHRDANAMADTKRVRRKPPSSSPRSGGADRAVVETQMQPAREPLGSGANPFEAFLSKKITGFNA